MKSKRIVPLFRSLGNDFKCEKLEAETNGNYRISSESVYTWDFYGSKKSQVRSQNTTFRGALKTLDTDFTLQHPNDNTDI